MSNPNNVVVVLEYDPERFRANATISFYGPRPDIKVLDARAETVPGVRYASSLLNSTQELEVVITAHHAQTREAALAVVQAVLRELGLTVIGQIRVEPLSEPKQHKTKFRSGGAAPKPSKAPGRRRR